MNISCSLKVGNASARTEVVELMTHNAKGEVIDAYTSWEWSTLCDEITKLEVDLQPAKLVVLPLAKVEHPKQPQFRTRFLPVILPPEIKAK